MTEPYVSNGVKHVFHQYVVRVEDNFSLERNELYDILSKSGIGVAVHYPFPIYMQPFYMNSSNEYVKCPNTEDSCKRVLSLPVHPIVSQEDIDYILAVIKNVAHN